MCQQLLKLHLNIYQLHGETGALATHNTHAFTTWRQPGETDNEMFLRSSACAFSTSQNEIVSLFLFSSFVSFDETIVAVLAACKILFKRPMNSRAFSFGACFLNASCDAKQVNGLTIREAVTIIVGVVRVWPHVVYQSSAASENHVTQQMQMRLFHRKSKMASDYLSGG